MKIKKIRTFWTILLTGLVVSFFPAVATRAANNRLDISQGDIIIEGTCDPCVHIITGTTNAHRIIVKSGTHDITLDGVNIDLSSSVGTEKGAFRIEQGATVNLFLKGNNIIKSGGTAAGIYVPSASGTNKEATLTIGVDPQDTNGTLEVTAIDGGAGIGGESAGNTGTAGNITINSGKVTANGGAGAAGIGGSNGGGAGNITINGGEVTANGGDNPTGVGGAGIGGGGGIKTGNININGAGTIRAIGGVSTQNNSRAEGICCNSLTAGIGNEFDIETNSLSVDMEKFQKEFNGIVWLFQDQIDANGDLILDATNKPILETKASSCTIYGNATLSEKLRKYGEEPSPNPLNPNKVLISKNASLTIPSKSANWNICVDITGAGKLINANKVSPSSLNGGKLSLPAANLCVLLEAGYFHKLDDLVFIGEDLTDKVLNSYDKQWTDPYTKRTYYIDSTGWNTAIKCKGAEVDKIFNAGTYNVTWTYQNSNKYDPINLQYTVKKADLSECKINPPEGKIADQIYTGLEITQRDFTLEVWLSSYKLHYEGEEGWNEYAVTLDENKAVGTAKVSIVPPADISETLERPINFTGELKTTFEIKPIPIDEAEIALGEAFYNGSNQPPKVEVILNEAKLDPAFYDLKWTKDGNEVDKDGKDAFKNAGTYELTVTGKENYGGTVNAKYIIKPIELSITGATAEDKVFDNTPDVNIKKESIQFSTGKILEDDKNDIEIGGDKITGKVLKDGTIAVDVGSYSEIKVEGIPLKNPNYIIVGDVRLTTPVNITQRSGPVLTVEAGEYNPADDTHFLAQLTPKLSDNIVEGYEYGYEFKMGDGEWQQNGFIVVPDTEYTFSVRTVGTGNIASSESQPVSLVFPKKDQAAPEPGTATLSDPAQENPDGTYTLSISSQLENIEYSFEDAEERKYSDSATKDDCEPNTEYTGYIRYKETPLYKASAPIPTTNKVTTGIPTVTDPIISEGGEFRGTKEINISCQTKDAEIRYTLDGTDPDETSKLFEGPFKIGESLVVGEPLTIKAKAFRTGMNSSGVTSAIFTKTGDEEFKTRTTTIEGIKDISSDLQAAGYSTAESIEERFRQILAPFQFEDIAFYDMSVSVRTDAGWTPMTEENFPLEGLTVTVKCPVGTSTETHDFAVSHMHSYDSDRLGVIAGSTEEPTITETADGQLEFHVTSASPLAIAWKTASNDPNGENPNGENPNGENPNGENPNGENPNGENPNGEGGGGTTTGSASQNANGTGNPVTDAVSSIMPKTGDPASFIPWVVLAVASIGVLIGIRKRGKSKKKTKSGNKKNGKSMKSKAKHH